LGGQGVFFSQDVDVQPFHLFLTLLLLLLPGQQDDDDAMQMATMPTRMKKLSK
jgi:hypothetical protein